MNREEEIKKELDELIYKANKNNEKIIFIKKENYTYDEQYYIDIYCAYKGKIIYYE